MKIILSRDIRSLGKVGDVVDVKNGYGRNFLLPKKYAVVASKKNIQELQEKLNELKAKNDKLLETAKQVAELLNKSIFNTVRQASDDDTIYGSLRVKDVYNFITEELNKSKINFQMDIGGIKIGEPIKMLGRYSVMVEIFSDVVCKLRINVCRTAADFESDVSVFDKNKEKSLIIEKASNEKKSKEANGEKPSESTNNDVKAEVIENDKKIEVKVDNKTKVETKSKIEDKKTTKTVNKEVKQKKEEKEKDNEKDDKAEKEEKKATKKKKASESSDEKKAKKAKKK